MGRLSGKVALITGAARGIGRAQAVRFAQEGAEIIGIDLYDRIDTVVVPPATREDLEETAQHVRPMGSLMTTAIADVRDIDALRAAVEDGVFGGLDIVCATAGITSRGSALEILERTWQTMLAVNLTGVFHTCQVSVPHLMARGGGAMVLVSSIAGLRGLAGVAHYTAAKHGIVGLMRTLANELAPRRIRVNTIHPTDVDTPLIQNDAVSGAFRPDLDRAPTRAEFAAAARPMNMLDIPWVDPMDVANASLFLASDEARYITAVALPVDAGSTERQPH